MAGSRRGRGSGRKKGRGLGAGGPIPGTPALGTDLAIPRSRDTAFYPDNDNVNARVNYTYQDADQAINQPKVQLHCQAGVLLRLGAR